MSLCNVEFYDHQFNYIFNDSIESPEIDEDYLSPAESSIVIGKIIDIPVNGLIYIDKPYDFLGIVTSVDSQDYTTEIHFQPFITIFNQAVIFNTNAQGQTAGTSLEQYLSDLIYRYWIRSNDSVQNLSYLNTWVATNRYNWGFNIKSDTEGGHFSIVNMYDVLICNALQKYGIVLTPIVDRTRKKVTIKIVETTGSFYINADMNNVKINSFIVNDLGSITNKLEIWNSQNYNDNQRIYYYLHPDGTYDTNNTNRIEPVRLGVISVEPSEDTTFAEAAAEQAASEFGNVNPVNNIELEIVHNDDLVKPMELLFGQTVMLIHDNTIYTTMLTGRKLGAIVTLMFGIARTDLTKKIKMNTNTVSYSDKFINYRSATDTRTGFDQSVVGTKNYNALNNKPVLNGVIISNEQSLQDIGIDTISNSTIEYLVTNDTLPSE